MGNIDNGIVAVTSLWAERQCYWRPSTSSRTRLARRLPEGQQDAAVSLPKSAIALALIERAQAAGIAFRAVVVDLAYGENECNRPTETVVDSSYRHTSIRWRSKPKATRQD